MKKRIMTILVVAVMIVAAACPAVSACSGEGKPYGLAYEAAELAVRECNSLVKALVRAAQLTPYNDVPLMTASVNAVVTATQALVKGLGYETECTYTEYLVDGQIVLIDPLRVINPLD